MAQVPINPAILQWAMETAECDVPALAQAVEADPELIEDWLSGRAKPTKTKLSAAGKRLGRSNQFFLLREPPKSKNNRVAHLRAASTKSTDPALETKQMRSAMRIQRVGKWAADHGESAAFSLPRPGASASRYANTIREYLGWQTPTNLSKTQVFKLLRNIIEETGVIVLLQEAGKGNFRGFSLPDTQVPLIFINASYRQPALRTYTLLHELAHIGRGDEQACYEPDTAVERWCERFAAELLLPEDHLRLYLARKKFTIEELEDPHVAVRLISKRYGASWHSVAIRLRELGYGSNDLVQEIGQFSSEPLESGFSREPRTTPVRRLTEFGSTYPRLLFDAVETKSLPDLDARRYLRANGQQLREIELRLRQGAS